MNQRHFACAHCGAQNSCPESLALTYAGRRVTRWCESCRQLFDIEFPRTTRLGDLLFGKPIPQPPSETAWRELVRGMAAGNTHALYTLYDRLHRIVFTLMIRTSRDRQIAERLTLDTFYDVWHRAWTYDPAAASVVGWVLSHSRWRAMDHCAFERPSRRPMEAWTAWPMDQLPVSTPLLRDGLAQRIAGESRSVARWVPDPAAFPGWQDAGAGISYQLLARDAERAHVSMLVRLAPGAAYPPHTHAGVEELYLLDGELWIDDKKVRPGEYNRADAGSSDQRVWSETGCTCVLLTSTADILR